MRNSGFEGNFLKLTKAMYNNINSRVNVNGLFTNNINITRSIRQGCPYSMMLFVLTTVPFIKIINTNTNIKGHTTKYNRTIKMQMYADDTNLIITDKPSIRQIFKMYEYYGNGTEAKINKDKTEILPFGRWKYTNSIETPYKEYVKETVKILGGQICNNHKNTSILNWETLIVKCKEKVKVIKSRYVSLFGKCLLTNSLIYSKIWNIAPLLNINVKYIKIINSIVNSYLTNQKRDIRKELLGSPDSGGAGLIDIKKRLETLKLQTLMNIEKNDKSLPENDNLIYRLGTYRKHLTKQKIGPTRETIDEEWQTPIKVYITNKDKLKKKKETLRAKEIEQILDENKDKCAFKNIYNTPNVKFKSINIQIAKNLLPGKVNWGRDEVTCSICKKGKESQEHIFMKCKQLNEIREKGFDLLRIVASTQPITYEYLQYMKTVKTNIEYDIQTIVKKTTYGTLETT